MKKEKKIGFFRKIMLVMSDFRVYPHLLKTESLAKAIGHFTLFIFVLSLVMSLYFFNSLNVLMNDLEKVYVNDTPYFEMKDGVLDLDCKDVRILQNDLIVIMNTDYTYDECKDFEEYKEYEKYKNRVFINSDALTLESKTTIKNNNQQETMLTVSKETFDQIEYDFTKDSLYDMYAQYKETKTYKIAMFVFIVIITFVSYIITKISEIILYSLITMIYSLSSGIRLNFKNYIKIATYVVTLPYILETIARIYVGGLTETTYIITSILAFVYIIYAIRAIKIDAFLLLIRKPERVSKNEDGITTISLDPKDDGKYQDDEESQNEQEEKKSSEEDNSNETNDSKK